MEKSPTAMTKSKVLCLEDDLTIQTLVRESLPGFEIVVAGTVGEAEELLTKESFQAFLVDIQLPDGDGLRFVAKSLQKENLKKIPVLILSDHTAMAQKVAAFSLGVDDFVGKPFDPLELNARLSARVRRFQADLSEAKRRQWGDLLIDLDRQKAFQLKEGKEIDLQLTAIELKILILLTTRIDQVYSRDQILDRVWGDTFIADRTVDSHISHLRQKISSTRVAVETSKSFGYRAVLKP